MLDTGNPVLACQPANQADATKALAGWLNNELLGGFALANEHTGPAETDDVMNATARNSHMM
jgi:hypothetical protein